MSEPAPSTSSSKPQRAPKQPKAQAPPPAGGDSEGGEKQKSAKELKKEKRAAAVAARGSAAGNDTASGGRGGIEGSSGSSQRPGAAPHLSAPSAVRVPQAAAAAAAASSSSSAFKRQQGASTGGDSHHLFVSHLPPARAPDTAAAFNTSKLHPTIIRLGVLMAEGTLRGTNARTMATMAAFAEVIRDYECPDQVVLWKDLPIYISPMIAWLETCRTKGVGGGNAIRWLKSEINKLGEREGQTDAEAKAYLVEAIELYIRDRIEFADQVIADSAKEKILPGATVVTYARSSVVERALLEAWRDMKEEDPHATFEVIVVDSRPLNEGRALLESLSSAGLQCTYCLLPQLAAILQRASLVLLGGSALHSDGALYSRAGTAVVAMLAKEHRVPVVACVETYKFGERVVLDGVATNELADAAPLLEIAVNKGVQINKPYPASLTPLSLMYDLTPPSLITAVCTEIGFIPPSSVPTVLGKASGVV